jgi:hypothetical protein
MVQAHALQMTSGVFDAPPTLAIEMANLIRSKTPTTKV